jgi:glycosyltransferase involved in cell wall biosynthesis
MKVAYFTESLPPNTDGVVRTLCHLVDTLESEKVDFRFFSPVKSEDLPWKDRIRKVASVPFFAEYQLGIPYFHGIISELNRFEPDLIHVVSESLLGYYGLQYAKRKKIPVVSSYHTHFVSYFSYYGFNKIETFGWQYLQWFHNQCDRTYAPSPSAVQELSGRGFQDVELWQRGVEVKRFSPDYYDKDLRRHVGAENKPLLLFVGRLVKEKDLDDLIAADALLKTKGYNYKLAIVGDGPMREELEYRLPDAHIPGYQHGRDLSRWYATADMFVFPSTTETFGNVILESFASGTPAVGVRKGGVADIINHGKDGLIADAKSPGDFGSQIARLLDSPEILKRFSIEAQNTARQYSWNAINRNLLSSYENVLLNQN